MPTQPATLEANEGRGAIGPDSSTMRAARLHRKGDALRVDVVPRPRLRAGDVLVNVKACGIVPNVANVLNYGDDFLVRQPPLPAIFGLDAAGVVVETGEVVHGVEVGDRVYVNPQRSCGACDFCRMGQPAACEYLTLNGYFGIGAKSEQTFQNYPFGGYAEYMTAPQVSLVKLPSSVSFETAARWGYLGTAYGALRLGRVDMNTTVLVNGASGTLGLGAVLFALALGAPKILGVGRNVELLERVRAIAPDRIEVHSTTAGRSVAEWARSQTNGRGADVVIDALPPFTPVAAFEQGLQALARMGRHVNCGGVVDTISFNVAEIMLKGQSLIGSTWFTTAQGQEMANLAGSGQVKLDLLEHRVFSLENINEGLAEIERRDGGFSNIVVSPSL